MMITIAMNCISFTGARFFDSRGLGIPHGHPFLKQRNVPTAQDVSDKIFEIIDKDQGNAKKVSHIYMTFGQFIDHDLVSTLFNGEACKNTR